MTSEAKSRALRLADVLGNRRVAAALTMGFASGLPFALYVNATLFGIGAREYAETELKAARLREALCR